MHVIDRTLKKGYVIDGTLKQGYVIDRAKEREEGAPERRRIHSPQPTSTACLENGVTS